MYYQDTEHLSNIWCYIITYVKLHNVVGVTLNYNKIVFWHRVGSNARSGGSARDSARDRDRGSDWISEFV